jgi:hypothetical protein
MSWRHWLVFGIVAAITIIVFLFPPIPQSEGLSPFRGQARISRHSKRARRAIKRMLLDHWGRWHAFCAVQHSKRGLTCVPGFTRALAVLHLDRPIFDMGRIISGHSLKYITAALSAYWILRMLQLRRPIWAAHA